MTLPSFGLWWDALRFHLRHALTLLPVAPLLYVPVFTDVFHSYILKQMSAGGVRIGTAATVRGSVADRAVGSADGVARSGTSAAVAQPIIATASISTSSCGTARAETTR
ncbi:MAG TPA: hypothetical protein VL049_16630 [Candidatus Dormibacteraeota bacterium]|nr:hypothetical protein [Candidatus Dormibacteraeota bacterium]